MSNALYAAATTLAGPPAVVTNELNYVLNILARLVTAAGVCGLLLVGSRMAVPLRSGEGDEHLSRFAMALGDPPEWKAKLEASKVFAEQKVKSFEHLGFRADHVVMPPGTTRAQFAETLERANQDSATRAIIVQFPPPARLQPLVQRMDPAKDIDAPTKGRSPYHACATAEGSCRVVEPFAEDDPLIAVVGSKGFVGQGVVTHPARTGPPAAGARRRRPPNPPKPPPRGGPSR